MKQKFSDSNLFGFLAAEFANADLERKSDQEVVLGCIQPGLAEWHRGIIAEGWALLNTPNFPWCPVRDNANRYFETETEAREWLLNVLEVLEASVRTIPKRDPCA